MSRNWWLLLYRIGRGELNYLLEHWIYNFTATSEALVEVFLDFIYKLFSLTLSTVSACTVTLKRLDIGTCTSTSSNSRVCYCQFDKDGFSTKSSRELCGDLLMSQGGEGWRWIHLSEMQSTHMWATYWMSHLWVDTHFLTSFGKVLSSSVSNCTIWWGLSVTIHWSTKQIT